MIYLGCSGWSYPDWVGPFYPGTRTDKLDYYSTIFNTVEINTTFYSIPRDTMFRNWIKKVARKDFRFSIKFPGEVTHRQMMEDTDLAVRFALDFEKNYVRPMLDAGVLGAVLLQLPPYFNYKGTHRLLAILNSLSTQDIRYFVEPRHSTLYGNEQFRKSVNEAGAEVIEMDGPEKEFSEVGSIRKSFYLRLHGRNYELWNKRTENASDRYNYEYAEKEIERFSRILKKDLPRYDDAFIYFNNHPSGFAPRNASLLASLLGVKGNDPQKRLV